MGEEGGGRGEEGHEEEQGMRGGGGTWRRGGNEGEGTREQAVQSTGRCSKTFRKVLLYNSTSATRQSGDLYLAGNFTT